MSVILPSLAIGHTPTEELCFLLLFSGEPQQYHQHAHYTLIITTRRLFSSFMTHKQTPGVPTKFLKSSSSFYFSPSVAFQNLHHGCLTGRAGGWPIHLWPSSRIIVYLLSAQLRRHSLSSWFQRLWWLYASLSRSKTTIQTQTGASYKEYHPLLWDWQNYSRFPALSSSSAANGCLKIAPLETVIYHLWSPRL